MNREGGGEVVGNLTLITGQSVKVIDQHGERVYDVQAPESEMQQVETEDGTYIFPENVEFETFSRELFNVDRLFEQGYSNSETDSLSVIVQLDSQLESPAVNSRALATEYGLEYRMSLESVDSIVGSVDYENAATVAERLRQPSDVEHVYLDTQIQENGSQSSLATDTDDVQQDAIEESDIAMNQQSAIDENETVVAIADTGVDETHPDLDDGQQILERSFVPGTESVKDLTGHGTFIASLAVGTGEASDGQFAGQAASTKYMDLKVANAKTGGQISNLLAAIEFASKRDVDVISTGLSYDVSSSDTRKLVKSVIENATQRGSLVVTSGGNAGPDVGSLTASPGIVQSALTVGSVNSQGTDLAPYSPRGPTPRGYMKPDVLAPGSYLQGAVSSSKFGDPDIETEYATKSGTSMSVGVTSGVVARLFDANPNLGPAEVKGLLASTAEPLPNRNVYDQGSGAINLSQVHNTTLFVTSGTLNLGHHTTDKEVSRTVTIHNIGDDARTVSLNATATDIYDGTSGSVSTNQSTVTVPAQSTRTVELTVDTGSEGGLFSGRLTATPDEGSQLTTSFGYTRGFEVSVEKNTLEGENQTAEGDNILFQLNRAGFSNSTIKTYDGQSATFISYGGNVTVGTTGTDERTGEKVMLAKVIDVDSNETVVFNESNTVRYRIDASEIREAQGPMVTAVLESVIARQFSDNGRTGVFELRALASGQRSVRLSPDSKFNASIAATAVPRSSLGGDDPAPLDAPQAYVLHYATVGIDSSRTFQVNWSELATVNTTYYRTSPGQTYSVLPYVQTDGNKRWEETTLGVEPMGIGDRVDQTVYVTPGTAEFGIGAYKQEQPPTWSERARLRVPSAGSSRNIAVNDHPATGRQLQWQFANGGFGLLAALQKDLGHEVHANLGPVPNTFSVDIGDRLPMVFNTQGPGARLTEPVPVEAGDAVTVYGIGRNNAQPRSTTSTGLYHATYEPGKDSTPPAIDTYRIQGLTTNNTVPAGELTVEMMVKDDSDVRVLGAVGQFNLTDVSATQPQTVVQKALEEGDDQAILTAFTNGTVTPAEVRQTGPQTYELTADTSDMSDGERVDIRVLAIDEQGNLMIISTTNATKIGDGRPGVNEGPLKSPETTTTETTESAETSTETTESDETTGPAETSTVTTDSPTTGSESTEESGVGTPGFTGALALVALVGAALLALRRHD